MSRRVRRCHGAAMLVVASLLAVASTGAGAVSTAAAPRGAREAAALPALVSLTPAITAPRVAFTDDRDELMSFGSAGTAVAVGGFRHSGEASVNGQARTYVSTASDPNAAGSPDLPQGEVWLERPQRPPLRVTCDGATKTHPTPSSDGTQVAYASNVTGQFHIWVAFVNDPAGNPVPCEQMQRVQAASAAGDDLWPSWDGDDGLVFSSTRSDPLGDLYGVTLEGRNPVPASAAVRLTSGVDAETQPFAFKAFDSRYVVFTSTAYRKDGSLALLQLGASDSSRWTGSAAEPLWSASQPQSSEPTVADVGRALRLGFTSTESDPYGDVEVADLAIGDGIQVGTPQAVGSAPGSSESHLALNSGSGTLSGFFTSTTLSADIGGVVEADGSDRKVIGQSTVPDPDGARPVDDSAPAYSLDGLHLAWSRQAADGGREIVVAPADGSGAVPALTSRLGAVFDIDPVWSPDGTEIAYVRSVPDAELGQPPSVWVANLATHATRQLTPTDPDFTYWDESPSWSPDGKRLVISRAVRPTDSDVAVTLSAPTAGTTGVPFSFSASVKNNGPGSTHGQGVVLHITVPDANVTLDATDPRCHRDPASPNISCALGPMASRASTTLTFTGTGLKPSAETLTAKVEHLAEDPRADDDSSTATVTFTTPPPPGSPGLNRGWSAALTALGGALPENSRAQPIGVPATVPSQLWVIDSHTGAGAVLTTPSSCAPIRVCDPAAVEGRVPSWSPDGLRVAFERQGQVLLAALADINGDHVADTPARATGVSAVTGFGLTGPTPSRAFLSAATDPTWSPDGAEIVVTGQPAGQPEQRGIFAVAPDGTALRTIAQQPSVETEPAVQTWADLKVAVSPAPATVVVGQTSTLTMTGTNLGPARAVSARLQMELPAGLATGVFPAGCTASGSVVTCQVGTLDKGATASRSLVVTGSTAGSQPVTASVDSALPDRQPADNVAATNVVVNPPPPDIPVPVPEPVPVPVPVPVPETSADLAVAVTATPVGYVGGPGSVQVSVSNIGPTASTPTLQLSFPTEVASPQDPEPCHNGVGACVLAGLAPGDTATFAVPVHFTAVGTGAVGAQVKSSIPDPVPGNDAASASLEVRQPALRLSPEVVTPGGVTLVTGMSFPPGSKVQLTWDTGIAQAVVTASVEGDGTIAPTQLLVLRRDVLGIRNVVGTPDHPGDHDQVRARLLVAPQRVSPPDFVNRN